MKVLHIINNLGSGGAEKLIEEFIPIMNRVNGVSADVLLLTDQNDVFDKKLKENSIQVDIVPSRKIYSPINIYHIRKYVIKGKYDVVHVHLFPAFYWTAIASRLILKDKPKLFFTEHNTYNRRRDKFYFKYIDKYIYSSYHKIISISEKTQENLISWLNPKERSLRNYKVIENGINLNKYKYAEPYLMSELNQNFTQKTNLICMVGRFSEQKDQRTLIRAIKFLPENLHLLLVGEGALIEQNQNYVKELELNHRVHFLGFRYDVERILKSCDIVVLSSHWEGFGLAAVEGMAAGKPVIASNVSGLSEVVEGAGMLFPKGDSEELANIIYSLIMDKEKYERVTRACLSRSTEFSVERMAEGYINAYKESLCD